MRHTGYQLLPLPSTSQETAVRDPGYILARLPFAFLTTVPTNPTLGNVQPVL
jgi:hypothetical protein